MLPKYLQNVIVADGILTSLRSVQEEFYFAKEKQLETNVPKTVYVSLLRSETSFRSSLMSFSFQSYQQSLACLS